MEISQSPAHMDYKRKWHLTFFQSPRWRRRTRRIHRLGYRELAQVAQEHDGVVLGPGRESSASIPPWSRSCPSILKPDPSYVSATPANGLTESTTDQRSLPNGHGRIVIIVIFFSGVSIQPIYHSDRPPFVFLIPLCDKQTAS